MWSQHIDAEAVLEIPKEDERTTYGVVLAGAVDVDDEPVGVWQAFRSGASVQITSGAPADLVIARVTGPSAAALSVVDIAGQRDLVFAGGSSHVRIVFEDGPASLQVMLTSRDAPVPKHQHEKAWEVIGLLSANGTFSMGGDPVAASAERILAIPPATEHAWQPAGDMPLLAVQLYVPPGPEQRFKQLAESAGPP